MRVTILGCGGSMGVPQIGPDWGRCDPRDPRNRRRRASIIVETDRMRLLVDTAPDLREQLLDAGIGAVDAVLYTHAHADHLHGLNDLRAVNIVRQASLPVYGSAQCLRTVTGMFPYAFGPLEEGVPIYRPWLEAVEIDGPFSIGDIRVTPIPVRHGRTPTVGFRFNSFAYCPDVAEIPESSWPLLDDLQLWIVDAFQRAAHPTHAHVERTLGWIRRARPRRALLTHMSKDLDYLELKGLCPAGTEPAYDGLAITVPEVPAPLETATRHA